MWSWFQLSSIQGVMKFVVIDEPIWTRIHFSILIFNCHIADQTHRQSNAAVNGLIVVLLITEYNFKSSAKSLHEMTSSKISTISFTNSKKRSGPNAEPCGTPLKTLQGFEINWLTTTHCCLSDKKARIHLSKSSRIPYDASLHNNLEWTTESNSPEKST